MSNMSFNFWPSAEQIADWQNRFNLAYLSTKEGGVDPNPDVEIIAITNYVLNEQTVKALDLSNSAYNALTNTSDSTTYPDHAILRFANARGFDVYLTQLTIDGSPIKRYKNTLVHDSLRRDDDIRKNGEKLFEIGNEYVIDGTQVDRIADFYFKDKGKKKHLYSVSIKGFCPWYSAGDWYTFQLGAAGWNEHINSTVEVYDVTCSRTAGGIGSTTLVLREVEENWTKTTFYTARAKSGASPKRRSQQSNTLIVAASTFDGTYDYKCDGTDDDVEIQAAIDYVYNMFGGGTVQLTSGTYTCSAIINIPTGISLTGVGEATKIVFTSGVYYFYIEDGVNIYLSKLNITCLTAIGYLIAVFGATSTVLIENIHFYAISPTTGNTTHVIYILNGSYTQVNYCIFDDMTSTYNAGQISAIDGARGCTGNRIGNITNTGGGSAYGISNSKKCSNNNVLSATTSKYVGSYADNGTANACADTSDGGFNS